MEKILAEGRDPKVVLEIINEIQGRQYQSR